MDSLKETDKPAPNPSKHPRIEVDEELMRLMIAGQAPFDSVKSWELQNIFLCRGA